MSERVQECQNDPEGSCDVPQQQHRPKPQLCGRVKIQRRNCKKVYSFANNNERQRGGSDQLDQQWTKMLKRLQAYQREHDGSSNVPQQYQQDPRLGTWVMNQRRQYRDGSLKKDRCDRLEATGFEWTGNRANYRQTVQEKWARMFKRLQAYQQEHNGSHNVPFKYPKDPQLGYWVGNQRRFYKKGLLAKERLDELDKIGFEWRCREQSVQKQFKSDACVHTRITTTNNLQ